MQPTNEEYIKKNYSYNFALLVIDAFGFGAAYSMMVPTGFVPDVIDQLTDSWLLPSLIISLFFLGIFFSQFVASAFREKETYAKSSVIKWGTIERLGIVLLYLSLTADISSEAQLRFFFLSYAVFIFSAGAILPSYFDMVSRILYKNRSIFFALNLSLGSITGVLLSNYAKNIIEKTSIVNGYKQALVVVILVTTISFISLLIIREPKPTNVEIKKVKFSKEIQKKVIEWKNIYLTNHEIKYFCIANMVCVFPEAVSPFYSIWLLDKGFDKSILAQWVALIFIGQGIGSFIVPILGKSKGFKITYILGLVFHTMAALLFLIDPLSLHYIIFLFTGIGLGSFVNSLSNIAIELAKTGDAGNINALLGIFRMPGFVLLPIIVAFFVQQNSSVYILISILISCGASMYLVFRKIESKILPQIRFWTSDS
jgi:hypothetical protein